MGKKLYGYISKENIEYEWKTEPGACEVCQRLDGTIYDSTNDIPDRPHPNCKCHIEILEKESDEPVTDPIDAYREKIKDRKRNELELAKLLGDAKSLEQEIDEYIRRINEQDREVEKLESTIDASRLDAKDRQKLANAKDQMEYANYRGKNLKQDVKILQKKIEKSDGTIEEISKLDFELIRLNQIKEDLMVKYTEKWMANIGGEIFAWQHNTSEALALYKIGSSERNGNIDYVQKNGYMYESVKELKNNQLEKDFSDRLQKEIGKKDAPILVLNPDSTMAAAIQRTEELQTFITNNISALKNGSTISNKTITFKTGDMYNALHGAVIREAQIDVQGNLNIQITDVWNFNKNRPSLRGRLGEKYQENGELTNYGILIIIKIPQEKWQKVLQ
ncbi:MAG: hypothetical protein V8R83_09630 [Candidatus Gastranaerophilaceae bacterium]|uniref:hypothetical protein n=1 Tax=uncultured Eubacterium sp. TaxID=165185 RepID=UPI000A84290B